MPSSICLPPAASGPVRTVRKPMRIGLLCAAAGRDNGIAAVAASADRNNRRDLSCIGTSSVSVEFHVEFAHEAAPVLVLAAHEVVEPLRARGDDLEADRV